MTVKTTKMIKKEIGKLVDFKSSYVNFTVQIFKSDYIRSLMRTFCRLC